MKSGETRTEALQFHLHLFLDLLRLTMPAPLLAISLSLLPSPLVYDSTCRLQIGHLYPLRSGKDGRT
jgi:hypothetical protein